MQTPQLSKAEWELSLGLTSWGSSELQSPEHQFESWRWQIEKMVKLQFMTLCLFFSLPLDNKLGDLVEILGFGWAVLMLLSV